jgi:DNA-binding PadR family transcriptional regulator
MHGYEMIKEIEERSEGAWTPSAGSIYPTLQMLEDEGLIRGEDSDGKRRFALTETGQTEQEAKAEEVAPWDAVREGAPTGQNALRNSVGKLIAAVRQVGQAGDEDQRKQVTELLDETRRKVYAILADHGVQATVADARFAKPLDGELAERLARDHDLLVTIEENVLPGGFGAGVLEHLEDAFATGPGERARVLRVGLPDRYVTHGKPDLLRAEVGLTGQSVADRVLAATPSKQPIAR